MIYRNYNNLCSPGADSVERKVMKTIPLGWPWEAQSSPRVVRESWGLRSSHCRAEETSPRRPRPRELRAFFSCMAWRAIPGPLSNRKRRLRRGCGGHVRALEGRSGQLPQGIQAAPCWPGSRGVSCSQSTLALQRKRSGEGGSRRLPGYW